MKHQIYKLLFLFAALMMTGCDCPYLEERHGESDYEYYRRTGYNRLTADLLPGLWQCYYPMIPTRWHATISLAAPVPLPTKVCRSSSTQTIPRVPSSKTEYKITLIPISRSLSFVPDHTLVPENH